MGDRRAKAMARVSLAVFSKAATHCRRRAGEPFHSRSCQEWLGQFGLTGRGAASGVSRHLEQILDLLLAAFVGVLTLAVMYLVSHRDAYLRSPSAVAALVAVVALAAALLATFRARSGIRARLVVMVGIGVASLYAAELFLFFDP